MIVIVLLFVVLVGGGWVLGKGLGEFLFPKKEEKYTFNTTNIHIHRHEHKNISIIDDTTKKKIFELKESKDDKSYS